MLASLTVVGRIECLLGDMVAGNVVEEMSADDAKVTINRRRRPVKEGLAIRRALGYIWARVVQERNHDDELVDDAPGDDVDPEDQYKTLQVLVQIVETSDCGQAAEIAQ